MGMIYSSLSFSVWCYDVSYGWGFGFDRAGGENERGDVRRGEGEEGRERTSREIERDLGEAVPREDVARDAEEEDLEDGLVRLSARDRMDEPTACSKMRCEGWQAGQSSDARGLEKKEGEDVSQSVTMQA